MGALMDNLEVLTRRRGRRQLGPRGTNDLLRNRSQDPLAQLMARPDLS